MHIIDQEEPSEEFQAAWNSAGKHIQAQCRGGIKWIRVNLRRPFIEHFSFIIGNQLFFVFVEAENLSFLTDMTPLLAVLIKQMLSHW